MTKIKTCIVCGSSKLTFSYQSYDRMLGFPGEFSVSKCNTCSLLFLNPQPSPQALKKYYPSKNYYAYMANKKKGVFERLREYLVAHYYSPNLLSFLISSFVQNVPGMPSYVKSGKILDLGCGAGDTLVLLKDLGWNTYGLDMDKKALENAKKRGLKNIKFGTYQALKTYPDNYFDAIRLYHVIEHIDNPSLCLELIRKKLKKNGELLIGTPNGGSIVSNIFKSYWYNLDSPRHVFLFSPNNLGIVVKREKFGQAKIEYCSAGGVVGSLQYVINEKFNKKIDLIHNLWIVLLFYPLDWLLNKTRMGDVFVLRARANKK